MNPEASNLTRAALDAMWTSAVTAKRLQGSYLDDAERQEDIDTFHGAKLSMEIAVEALQNMMATISAADRGEIQRLFRNASEMCEDWVK